jgi:hypothetical protein
MTEYIDTYVVDEDEASLIEYAFSNAYFFDGFDPEDEDHVNANALMVRLGFRDRSIDEDEELTCDTCGRVGSRDDAIEPGGPCQEPCDGIVRRVSEPSDEDFVAFPDLAEVCDECDQVVGWFFG